jgi:hypothetical protein
VHWPGSEEPHHPSFWFRMSVATIVGGVVAIRSTTGWSQTDSSMAA